MFGAGVITTRGTVLKDCSVREVENHFVIGIKVCYRIMRCSSGSIKVGRNIVTRNMML